MPVLETERLLLRPPESRDAPYFADALNDLSVARNMVAVPHPFTQLDAEAFIANCIARRAKGEAYTFAIVQKGTGRAIGCITLTLTDGVYKLNYWLARPFWNKGYASEAARKMLGFAFHALKADRVMASWFADNPASGNVLMKLGFEPVEVYRRESLARGGFVICNRTQLRRENFGRKRPRLDHPDFLLEAVGA